MNNNLKLHSALACVDCAVSFTFRPACVCTYLHVDRYVCVCMCVCVYEYIKHFHGYLKT